MKESHNNSSASKPVEGMNDSQSLVVIPAPDPEPKTALEVDVIVDALFVGRKGHGGGPCTYRVLRPNQIREILQQAYEAGKRAK